MAEYFVFKTVFRQKCHAELKKMNSFEISIIFYEIFEKNLSGSLINFRQPDVFIRLPYT